MITRVATQPGRVVNYMEFVPYITTMDGVYTAETLYDGYDPEHPETFKTCYDQRVYDYFLERGKMTDEPLESMARAMHDHFVIKGMNELLARYEKYMVVGVMGGSAMKRTDPAYRQIALVSKHLTELGSLMVSGGGPGAMEATALGAFLAGRDDAEIDKSLAILAKAPCYDGEGYMEAAFEVYKNYGRNPDYECLSIPTWLYGHEPTAPFASHIAKLFGNCVREDLLLTVAYGGILYSPGSAGTMQEIFQDAVQNHYLTLGISSPMVFLGREFWTQTMPAYTMLKQLSDSGRYKNLLLSITDREQVIVDTITQFQQHCRETL